MSADPPAAPAVPADASPEGQIPINEFHREIAVELFNQVLGLLHSEDRTCAENDRMIHAAHASRFHWEFGGTVVNLALGEWQCACVHTAMAQTESALHHAWRYLEMAEGYGLGPFHLAHAHLTVAAALAPRSPEDSAHQLDLARELFPHVEEEEEKELLNREAEKLTSPPAPHSAQPAAPPARCC
jgi:hypothetical protein